MTDFYQFTMAQAYFDQKRHNVEAVFHLFFRKNPFAGNWALTAGIGDAMDFVAQLNFSDDAIKYLATLCVHEKPLFSKNFLDFLKHSDARVDISGVSDGTIVFPNQPIVRVSGPLFLCQLLETPLLNIINFQTLIATKASRVKIAANNKSVMDFGLRRAQGFDGAASATKAAFIGGITMTSNVWAAKNFGMVPSGTQAHSFIMSYDDQRSAFDDFCASYKDNAVLLVDTYDALAGIDDAIAAFTKLKAQGHQPLGLRLDSGDLAHLAKHARAQLDRAGFYDAKIIASGDLDEYAIEKLEASKAPIDSYGVGTRLITAHDDPALTGVYKLSSIHDGSQFRDTYKAYVKNKTSWPGHQAIMRFYHNNKLATDVVYDHRFGLSRTPTLDYDRQENLHQPLMDRKHNLYTPSLLEMQAQAHASLSQLPAPLLSLAQAKQSYPVYFDDNIAHKRAST